MTKTRVFLSWSGELSEYVAQQFKTRLTHILREKVDPFFSKDISGGKRGIRVIEEALREANHGLLFLTRENRGKEWIPFEAGAIGKDPNNSLVCPILIGFPSSELTDPLSLFQVKEIGDESGIVGVFDEICKAVRGPHNGLKVAEEADLKAWLTGLNDAISERIATTVEGNERWATTTLARVSRDTQSSPFQHIDALCIARKRVVFAGQNLYSLSKADLWEKIKDFLLYKRNPEHGAPASERSVELLFLAPDDDKKAEIVNALVTAWAYTVAENPDKFRENLTESVDAWRQRQAEAKKGGFEDRLKVRLATTFIPLSQTFVDPGQTERDGKLFLRPFYRGAEAEKRPTILLTEKHNGMAFDFYWNTHKHLWENSADTQPL